ncbi:MAG: hypothetical protein D6757_00620 [Alphaproteobacteria bacterium]|nr:MAG: hypothetical protein D6757_00620 [Alphaproteobacteria bacterium]
MRMKGGMMTLLAAALLSGAMALSGAQAHDDHGKAKGDPLANLEKTGRTARCLHLERIDTTKILDRQHILFRMRGGQLYLNTLPHACPGLTRDRALSYSLSMPELCDLDIVTVIDTGTHQEVGSCGLGKFEEVKEKTSAAKDKGEAPGNQEADDGNR